MQIRIDKEFENLIPPLSDEEREQLETNLIGDGVREPLTVWDGILIDGHNRYKIAKEYGLEFETVEMEFGSRDEAKIWVIQNQLGRRNLSMWDRSKLALSLKPVIQGKTPNARDDLAELAGVSTNTIQRADYLEKHADKELLSKLDSGEVSINKAYTDIKKPEEMDFSDIKGDSREVRNALLERLPTRESKIGLPYQKIATRSIRCIVANDIDGAIDGVMELLKEPSPATIALAKIILEAMSTTQG